MRRREFDPLLGHQSIQLKLGYVMSLSNQKGDIGEAYFVLRATEKGYWVGKMPQDCPYDYVLDRGTGPERIQVKYRSSSKKGTIQLTSSNSSLSSNRSYKSLVDYFAVFNPETTNIYLIPATIALVGTATVFRVEPSKSNNAKNVKYLTEFADW